jgi:hypothetical protein
MLCLNQIAETLGQKLPFQNLSRGKAGKWDSAGGPAGAASAPGGGGAEDDAMDGGGGGGDDDDDDDAAEGGDDPEETAGNESQGIPDMVWLNEAREKAKKDNARLTIELTGYMSNLIKESIRVS